MKFKHLIIGAALWAAATPCAFAVTATGGNTTNTSDGYRIHTFTNSATAGTFVISSGGSVEVLMVAGGGGGGNCIAGGGGGGGLIYSNALAVDVGAVPVSVGQGGSSAGAGGTGNNSIFGVLVANGGGGGGNYTGAGKSGGSGGGSGSATNMPPLNGQGHQGGSGNGNAGGGGGGAGTAGTNGTGTVAGAGGGGWYCAISGTLTPYAGGGGGGSRTAGTPGSGGIGGGGDGAKVGVGSNAVANTGGGGGGGSYDGFYQNGGTGGSGIVIVRYSTSHPEIENGIASNVAFTSAWLNGTLVATGASATVVFAYWGPSDGGTEASAWANTNIWAAPQVPGSLAIQATGLTANATYYYRFAASNATAWVWVPESSVFITGDVWIDKLSDASEIGPTPGTFTVHRAAAATNEALDVTYTVGGTAINGTDYSALSGTVTIPKGEQTATIEVLPVFDHLVEGLETVVVTLAPGLYVIGTASNATIEIADYGQVTQVWSGGGANALASTPANWVGGTALLAGDAILVDSRTNKNMTWDLNIPVQSWTQDGYTGTVTLATVYPGQSAFTNFAILGDCTISNGVWTHIANPTVNFESNRLCVTIGGNLIVGSNAAINVTAKGYRASRGPGTGSGAAWGGSYGGRGINNGGPCYGSIQSPLNLGSGGNESVGGGAIRLWVAGMTQLDGSLLANGGAAGSSGAGGSIYLTSGTLSGGGAIRANGGNPIQGYVGGGGRIALVVTNASAEFQNYFGAISAYGGAVGSARGCAGTIYLEQGDDFPGRGELRVDNAGGGVGYASVNTDLSGVEAVACEFSRLTLTNGANLSIGPDDTLILTNCLLQGAGGTNNGIWIVAGGTLLTPPMFVYSNLFIAISETGSIFNPAVSLTIGSNGVLRIDQPHTLAGDLIVAAGGTVTHTANTGTEAYKTDLTVEGDLTVQAGGSVDVTERGYAKGVYGPGSGVSPAWSGSYGGRGGYVSYSSGPCYGSIRHPFNLGSSGNNSAGGGAVRLAVLGSLHNDGLIAADGGYSSFTFCTGSGGSVQLTAGALTGGGIVRANGGGTTGGNVGGGGGRVAVTVTHAGTDLSGFSGTIAAYGATNNTGVAVGAAGTVYLRAADQAIHEGVLIVDNGNRPAVCQTEIHSNVTDTVVGDVLIRNAGNLLVCSNQTLTLSSVWSNAATFSSRWGSRVIVAGAGGSTSVIYGSSAFMGFVCTNAGKTLLFQAGTTNTVPAQGRLTLRGTSSSNLILRSTAVEDSWKLNVSTWADQSVGFVNVQDSDALEGTGAPIIAAQSTDSGRNTNWQFVGDIGETNVWLGAIDTAWSLNANWSLGRAPLAEDFVRIPAGRPRYTVLSFDRTVNGLLIESGASLSLAGYNLTVTGDATVAGTLIAAGTETVMFGADADFTGGTIEPVYSTFAFAGSVTQYVDPAGLTFYSIHVVNPETVVFQDDFSAHELRCVAPNGMRCLVFEQGTTVTVRDLVLLGSAADTNIVLRSSSEGQAWNLVVSGYRGSVRGVDVRDSDARAGLPIPALFSKNSGNNLNWEFGAVPSVWLGTSGNNFHTAANWNPAGVPGASMRVLVEGAHPMTLTGAVTVLDLTVGGGIDGASVTVNGSLTVGENAVVLGTGTLTWNQPGVVSNDLIVQAGGLLTHEGPQNSEMSTLDLTVFGNVGVDVNGNVNVTGKGYAASKGPGAGSGAFGGSHGGRTRNGGPCYGSILGPTNLGSGANQSPGGGTVRLRVAGTIRLDGLLQADGGMAGSSGSGGSVWLASGALTGNGAIRANGGDPSQGYPGGGGRIALVVTNAGANFTECGIVVSAWGGIGGAGGAGTIYRQCAADRSGRGEVAINNNGILTTYATEVPPASPNVPGEADRATLRVSDRARLRLTNNFMVGDIWLDTANAVLDLGGYTLTVNTRKHHLGSGSVLNEGTIIWTGLPPGVLIIVK